MDLVKKCVELLGKMMKHQYGWVFNEPVDAKKLKLNDYYKIIKHPMDLGTVKSRLSKNWYKSPKEFAEDVRLTFNNAMTYNEKGQDVHTMADVLLKVFEENWAIIKAKYNFDEKGEIGCDASLPKHVSKRAPGSSTSSPARGPSMKRTPGPRASSPAQDPASAPVGAPSPAPPLQSMPLEMRTSDGTDSLAELSHSKRKAANSVASHGGTSVSKKSKMKESERREMTFEVKQKLSISLQSLPSDKLESVVQIIRKRNPGLFQQEDEIEVDIDSFDNETLWELNMFVTNYQKSVSKNDKVAEVALQGREEAGHNMHGTNSTFAASEAPKELGTVQRIVSTSSPIKEGRQGRSISKSSSLSSSGSDSRSSSSGSDSGSGSGPGSDAIQ